MEYRASSIFKPSVNILPLQRPFSHRDSFGTGLKSSQLMLWRYSREGLYRVKYAHRSRRKLVTLAIETSCDDTCVAVVEKPDCTGGRKGNRNGVSHSKAKIHYHEKITSKNLQYQGIHPTVASSSHQRTLGHLIARASQVFSQTRGNDCSFSDRPDFITVTRGPGMRAALQTGLDMAKGLAVAWQIPFVGVHHMQAHLLTPRLVSALSTNPRDSYSPEFPFLSLLMSGGHTILVESRSLNDHSILASTLDIAIGDALDKISRCLLPKEVLESSATVSYGPVLEEFAFPGGERDYHSKFSDEALSPNWTEGEGLRFDRGLRGPRTRDMVFSFTGMFSTASRISQKVEQESPLTRDQMRSFARDAMTASFEQIASRVVLALEARPRNADQSSRKPDKVVISGGVAANKYMQHVYVSS